MSKVVVDCADPNDMTAIEETLDQIAGRCNVTYYRNAEQRVNNGKARSYREASRQIAEETGESENAVLHRVKRGRKEVGQGGPKKSKPQQFQRDTPEKPKSKLTDAGGKRPGAGRPRKNEEWEAAEKKLNELIEQIQGCIDIFANTKLWKKEQGRIIALIQKAVYYAAEKKQGDKNV